MNTKRVWQAKNRQKGFVFRDVVYPLCGSCDFYMMPRITFLKLVYALSVICSRVRFLSSVKTVQAKFNNFEKCVRKKDVRYASCSIPDLGFSLSLPHGLNKLNNFSLAFIGDSFIEQVFYAFQCMNLDISATYYKGGISKSKMCSFLSKNEKILGKDSFDILIISEGLWFNPGISQSNGMQVKDYIEDVSCALHQLKKLDVKFLWVQRSFQHFNTKDGIVPRKVRHLSRGDLKKYANCLPVKDTKKQLEYHQVVQKNLKETFPLVNHSNFILEDITRDLYMLHTHYQREQRSIPDCTHFCQRMTGVPYQYAKRIIVHMLGSESWGNNQLRRR